MDLTENMYPPGPEDRTSRITAIHEGKYSLFVMTKTAAAMKQILVTIISAVVFFHGCVSDDAVITEDFLLSWERVESAIGCKNAACIAIDEEGDIFAGINCSTLSAGGAQSTGEEARILVSRDNGESWEDTGFSGRDVESIVSDRDGRIFIISSRGRYYIQRSSDGGSTWKELDYGFEDMWLPGIVADPEGWIFLVVHNKGLYRSIDKGDSWSGIFNKNVLCITFDPANRIYIGTREGLYRSDTRGDDWYCMDTTVAGNDFIYNAAVDGDGRIFVRAASPGSIGGLYRSTNDGDTWERLCVEENCYPPSGIFITPDNTVFVAVYPDLYRSEDNGDTWTKLSSGYVRHTNYGNDYSFRSIRSLDVDPAGAIYLLTDEFIFRSVDGGDTWTIIGLPNKNVADIAVDTGGRWWASFTGGGVYYSLDNLSSWNQFNTGLINVGVVSLAVSDGGFILAGTSTGIYRSPLDYTGWLFVGPDSLVISDIATGGNGCLLAGTSGGGVYISHDIGNTWANIGMEGYEITTILVDDGGDIYAGADFGGAFRYTGEGIVWDQLNEGLENLHLNTMILSPGKMIFAGTEDGIYLLDADSLHWEELGLNEYRVAAIYIDSGNNIVAGTNEGVFMRSPDLSRWEPVSHGIYHTDINKIDILIAGPDDYLYAIGKYIYRSSRAVD